MTQTWPGAKLIGLPDAVVKVVPALADGRDQCTVHALPERRTTALPDPVLSANGGRRPFSRNREVPTVVRWITTVAAESCTPRALTAGIPFIDTSQRPSAADQVNVNEAAG